MLVLSVAALVMACLATLGVSLAGNTALADPAGTAQLAAMASETGHVTAIPTSAAVSTRIHVGHAAKFAVSAPGRVAAVARTGHDFGKFAAAKYLACTASAKITGTFELNVGGVTASFAKWTSKDKGKQFKASVAWSTTISAAVDVTAKTTCTPGKALKKIGFSFPVDGVKVTLHPDFKLEINAAGNITASQTTGQSLALSGKLGLSVPGFAFHMTPRKPTVTASGSADFDALIGAEAILTAGVATLDFELMGGVHGTAASRSNPPEVCVAGYPELLTAATIKVPVLKWKKEFLDRTWPIKSVAGHPTTFNLCTYIPPKISSTALPQATVGKAYSAKLATADKRPGTWKIASGTLPAGLSLSGASISGTPTTAGTSKFTLSFTDSTGHKATAAAAITVTAGGLTWAAAAAPLPSGTPAGAFPVINGVSCPSTSSCVAVGQIAVPAAGETLPVIYTRSAGAWTARWAPVPGDSRNPPDAYLYGVSCASASFCVAVGEYYDGSYNQGLVLTWSGGAWTAGKAILPADATTASGAADLSGVSCPSTSFCTAVGVYMASSGPQGWLLSWSGGVWTAAQSPVPADASGEEVQLRGVSCPSASSCVAVGEYNVGTNVDPGLILTWSAGKWTAASAPLLPGRSTLAGTVVLEGVSCPAVSFCTAAGGYNNTVSSSPDYGDHGILLTWSGGTWTAALSPLPGDSASPPAASLASVFCVSASSCAAVGQYDNSTPQGLALTRSGASWLAAKTPLPVADAGWQPQLTGASCASTTSCVAVGFATFTTATISSQTAVLLTSSG
jgi:hypothetical protein